MGGSSSSIVCSLKFHWKIDFLKYRSYKKMMNTKNVENRILNNFKNVNFCLKSIFKRQEIKVFFEKCPDFRKNMCHRGRYLCFNFVFIRFFFRSQLSSQTFWSRYRAIFLIFGLIWQEIAFFGVKNDQKMPFQHI